MIWFLLIAKTAQVAATGTGCNWRAELLEVLWSALMQTLVGEFAEFVDESLRCRQPTEIIAECRRHMIKLLMSQAAQCSADCRVTVASIYGIMMKFIRHEGSEHAVYRNIQYHQFKKK